MQADTTDTQKAAVIWLTGLSGAGKTSLAQALSQTLNHLKISNMVLDGDVMRQGLCADLDYSPAGRSENLRRVAELAKLLSNANVVSICALISPLAQDRASARAKMPTEFIEVYCSCHLTSCEARDVKGLYAKARAGIIADFTGVSALYEPPQNPDLTIDSSLLTVEESVDKLLFLLKARSLLPNASKM